MGALSGAGRRWPSAEGLHNDPKQETCCPLPSHAKTRTAHHVNHKSSNRPMRAKGVTMSEFRNPHARLEALLASGLLE